MNAIRIMWCTAVFAAVPGAGVAADAPQVARGLVTEVKPADNQLTLKTRDGKDLRLHADAASRLRIDDRAAALADFKEGGRVRVTYAADGGKNRVVSMTATPATTPADLKREVADALQAGQEYGFQKKEQYEARLRDVVDRIDDRIEELEERSEKAGAAAKEDLKDAVRELRKRRGAVNDRLAKVKTATAEAWDETTKGLDAALQELQDAFRSAAAKFK